MNTASLLCEFVHVACKLTTGQTTAHNACTRVPFLGSLLPCLLEHVLIGLNSMPPYLRLFSLLRQSTWFPFKKRGQAFLSRLMSLPYIPNEMNKLVRKSQTVQSSMFSSGIVVTQVLIPTRLTPTSYLPWYPGLFSLQNMNGQTPW